MNKKRPSFRIERVPEEHIEDDTTHLWAVSYADFLMVLLSFFILFFSVGEENRDHLVRQIAEMPWAGEKMRQQNAVVNEKKAERSPASQTSVDIAKVKELLLDHQLNIDIDKNKTLTLRFPDNIYRPGQYSLNAKSKKYVRNTLNRIQKYWGQLEFTFIGHADNLPLRKNGIIQSNHDLSALRATRALQEAISVGLPEENLISEGWGSLRLNARSLSILIRPLTKKFRQPASVLTPIVPPSKPKYKPTKRQFHTYQVK